MISLIKIVSRNAFRSSRNVLSTRQVWRTHLTAVHNLSHAALALVHSRYLTVRQKPRFLTTGRPSGERLAESEKKHATTENENSAVRRTQDADKHYEHLALPVSFPGSPGGAGGTGGGGLFPITKSPLFDAALTTLIGLGIVFLGGAAYINWYKWNVLAKMEKAFEAGYDPALELALQAKQKFENSGSNKDSEGHIRRQEQDLVDSIISGKEKGHYWLFLGPKGAGKTTMIYDAMCDIDAEGVAVCEAHPDLEVFRLRLGKALNYEFNEDSQTGLFQRRDPREGGPGLDIERALNKLEKVAFKCSRRNGRPLVLVLNNIHHFQQNDEGRGILLQLQQRAEAWAESGILTMVFSSDGFWPYLVLRTFASRMHTLSIYDIENREALRAMHRFRRAFKRSQEGEGDIKDALEKIGGRVAFISRLSKADNISAYAEYMVQEEKGWLNTRIGLIPDHDDDVMDEQKWSSCSWLLLQEFVRLHAEHEKEMRESGQDGSGYLPAVTYERARQIMTRTDFIDELDRLSIINIDVNFMVRPDSMLVLQAAKRVVDEPEFEEALKNVRDRVDEIESLHRTRELTFKDVESGGRIRLTVDKGEACLLEN